MMATKKKTTNKTTPKKTPKKVEKTEEIDEEVEKKEKVAIPKPKKRTVKKKKVDSKAKRAVDNLVKDTVKADTRKERDMNEMISVISIVNSPLLYKSKAQQGYSVEWGEFLEENWMEYKELITMRNTQKSFFERPWVIMEWEVLEDLKVDRYYENMIDLSALDEVYDLSPDEMTALLKKVPKGIQELISERAYVLIEGGRLDSINLIEAIEDACNVELEIARN